MGCNASTKSGNSRKSSFDIDKFLTEDEKKLVRESWAIIAMDIPATGLHVFTRLFEMEKDLKKLFRRLMSQNESGDYIFDAAKLERHATMVMNSLGQAVENMDDSVYFSEMLHVLGEKHISYNVKPEMFPFLWPAIRDAMKMRLGDKLTLEGELAWKHMFDYIVSHLIIGMEEGLKRQNTKSTKSK